MVNALGDGHRAVVTAAHCVDGRDVVERHRGWSVPGGRGRDRPGEAGCKE